LALCDRGCGYIGVHHDPGRSDQARIWILLAVFSAVMRMSSD
jgi:hypothetical protein